mgnify:CR=1 FL=1
MLFRSELVKELGVKDLSKSMQYKLDVYEDNASCLVYCINNYKKYAKIDVNAFKLFSGMEATIDANEGVEKKILVFFVKLLSFKLKSIYFKSVLNV